MPKIQNHLFSRQTSQVKRKLSFFSCHCVFFFGYVCFAPFTFSRLRLHRSLLLFCFDTKLSAHISVQLRSSLKLMTHDPSVAKNKNFQNYWQSSSNFVEKKVRNSNIVSSATCFICPLLLAFWYVVLEGEVMSLLWTFSPQPNSISNWAPARFSKEGVFS